MYMSSTAIRENDGGSASNVNERGLSSPDVQHPVWKPQPSETIIPECWSTLTYISRWGSNKHTSCLNANFRRSTLQKPKQ